MSNNKNLLDLKEVRRQRIHKQQYRQPTNISNFHEWLVFFFSVEII